MISGARHFHSSPRWKVVTVPPQSEVTHSQSLHDEDDDGGDYCKKIMFERRRGSNGGEEGNGKDRKEGNKQDRKEETRQQEDGDGEDRKQKGPFDYGKEKGLGGCNKGQEEGSSRRGGRGLRKRI